MENRIIKFANEKFGEIRTMCIDGEAWFVGKDVAKVLGYSNATKAIIAHVDDEDKMMVMVEAQSQNGTLLNKTRTAFINESGLYSLIFSSKLDSAKEFKRWVEKGVFTVHIYTYHDVYGHQRSYPTTMVTGLGVQHLLDKFKALNS